MTDQPAPSTDVPRPERAALCIGHPGHELRVFGWMSRARPLVDVLTDGSGPDRPSRFYLTADLLANAGARLGQLQGAIPDRTFYDYILAKSAAPFQQMAGRLASEWIAHEIDLVAGDMLEGFSPTHDLCRVMINAAVRRVERETGRRLTNLEFPLERMAPAASSSETRLVRLTEDEFAGKRQAALLAYPALGSEVERLVAKHGAAAFMVEMLAPADARAGLEWQDSEPPYYETYGRRQIAQGHYRELITHAEHIRPLAEALYAWAES